MQFIHTTDNNPQREVSGAPLPFSSITQTVEGNPGRSAAPLPGGQPCNTLNSKCEHYCEYEGPSRLYLRTNPPNRPSPPPNPALTLKSALRSNPPAQASAHPCCQKELKAETHCARRTFQPPRRQSLSRAATAKKNDEGRLSDASCETQKFFLLNLLVPCIWVSGKANATGGR